MMTNSRVRPRAAAIAGLTLLVVAGILLWWIRYGRGPEPAVYEIPRTVRYSVTVQNTGNELLAGARFWVFAPVAQTAFQRVVGIEASMPYTKEVDAFGNQRLQFVVDIPPFGTKHVRIDAQLELASTANRMETDDDSRFLAAEDKIESDAEPIATLARSLSRGTATETADAIYNWVSNNVEYAGYVKDDRGALYALNNRRGDCTEYSYLYTALARASGIATRPIGGFVTAENAVLRARDFHNWAEPNLNGKWRVVDPQNRQNRVDEHHHIAMRVLGAGGEGLTSTHQLIGADEGLKIRMN